MKTETERSKERLLHIVDAANKIEKFTSKLTEQHFLKDDQKQGAVLFQFSIIGEAIIHIDSDILKKYNYPWHEVSAFRNMISHE
jgi:uncharacterized protein with HEPN domain